MSTYTELKKKIKEKKAVITVVGLGYVGLPIALEFCEKGFTVNGFDTNVKRIKKLQKGTSYIHDVSSRSMRAVFSKGSFSARSNDKVLSASDVIIICVPTPLRKIKNPDISYILCASRSLCKRMRPGQLVIVESTTYPGTTREVILPELEKSGLKLDRDFYLAFSPERIDPGNEKYGFAKIPKVIGGVTKKGTQLGRLLYSQIIKRVISVSSSEVAEVTKLLENTFRIVNIALINEFAMLCGKLNIDVWEVIKAARTKPFGYMPFYPGPGIGGHCIPADPMYLSWKARTVGFRTNIVDLAARINRLLPGYVVERVENLIESMDKKIKGTRILVIGAAYKKDVNDLRESPALEILETLEGRKAAVTYHDPYIPYLDLPGIRMKSRELSASFLKKQDIVLIVTDHSNLDYDMIARNAKLIFDTRNAFEHSGIAGRNIVKL
ncbi:nucleotide sugar dehydrogenase [Candidatus Omnitrophota bacterium]